MTTCKWNSTCEKIRNLMHQMGVDKSSIAGACSEDGPCPSIFTNMSLVSAHLNIDNSHLVYNFLLDLYDGKLPIDHSSSTVKQIFNQRPFSCPEVALEIRQPCRIQSCSYWTNHPWTRNCILFYRLDQGRDGLDLKELTFLLDKTKTELRKRVNSILAESRRWALHTKTDGLERAPSVASVVDDCCCACGGKLDSDSILKNGLQYCSRDCLGRKPPLDFRIEREFNNLPIERILRICIDSFASRRPMCHALNITTKQLEDLCDRYGIDIAASL